ncbi:MAG: hypothetical protein PVG99_12585 [Desulfobacteraceae bacterium]|jgi:aspartokinase
MASAPRLGGFKILKDVVRISMVTPRTMENFPASFCRIVAAAEINLPYMTCIYDGEAWGLNIMVEAVHEAKISHLIDEHFGKIFSHNSRSAILSIFPHKKNPDITGRLFETFDQQGVEPDALANSPSAISVILREELLSKASSALFEPFTFSAYRTPSDWKLAQKGKEQLYKEVVASYQEQQPKVYGLDYHEGQDLVRVRLDREDMGHVGTSFRGFARLGLDLTFLVTSPCLEKGKEILAFCLPTSESETYTQVIGRIAPQISVSRISPVIIFSMNGPHFGDRYGIASELLTAFEHNKVDLLGLSCTIASITGVVPSHQFETTIQAIQGCFEVPSITKKD